MEFNGINFDTYFKNYPNTEGYFGKYGGAYVSEDLKKAWVISSMAFLRSSDT